MDRAIRLPARWHSERGGDPARGLCCRSRATRLCAVLRYRSVAARDTSYGSHAPTSHSQRVKPQPLQQSTLQQTRTACGLRLDRAFAGGSALLPALRVSCAVNPRATLLLPSHRDPLMRQLTALCHRSLSSATLALPVSAQQCLRRPPAGLGIYTYGSRACAVCAFSGAFPHLDGSLISILVIGAPEVPVLYEFATPHPVGGLSQLSFDVMLDAPPHRGTTRPLPLPHHGDTSSGMAPTRHLAPATRTPVFFDSSMTTSGGTGPYRQLCHAAAYQTPHVVQRCALSECRVIALAPFCASVNNGPSFPGLLTTGLRVFDGRRIASFGPRRLDRPEPASMTLRATGLADSPHHGVASQDYPAHANRSLTPFG